jgi:hypothetical protein
MRKSSGLSRVGGLGPVIDAIVSGGTMKHANSLLTVNLDFGTGNAGGGVQGTRASGIGMGLYGSASHPNGANHGVHGSSDSTGSESPR